MKCYWYTEVDTVLVYLWITLHEIVFLSLLLKEELEFLRVWKAIITFKVYKVSLNWLLAHQGLTLDGSHF